MRLRLNKLYFAYGMNTNHDEMSFRCPNARFIGNAVLPHHRLAFRHVADFEKAKGFNLHGAIWLITDKCERALDGLEGFPTFYTKVYHYVDIKWQNRIFKKSKVMIYQMVNQFLYNKPSTSYFKCLLAGYKSSRLPLKQLLKSEDST